MVFNADAVLKERVFGAMRTIGPANYVTSKISERSCHLTAPITISSLVRIPYFSWSFKCHICRSPV